MNSLAPQSIEFIEIIAILSLLQQVCDVLRRTIMAALYLYLLYVRPI
jgi:hypothetical protein